MILKCIDMLLHPLLSNTKNHLVISSFTLFLNHVVIKKLKTVMVIILQFEVVEVNTSLQQYVMKEGICIRRAVFSILCCQSSEKTDNRGPA